MNSKEKLLYEEEKCIVCAGCVSVCPFEALDFHGLKWHLTPDRCTGCAICIRFCPTGAISLEQPE